jgi:hypothetical protein
MKRQIVATILGIAASAALVTTSFGQGKVFFANYNTASGSGPSFDPGVNAPVTFGQTANVGGVNGISGGVVGAEFTADLLFSLDGGATYSRLTTAQAGDAGYPTAFFGTDNTPASAAGYFQGPFITIPGYSSGPISFIVEAYHGSSYAAADWKGQSAAFTLNSIATGQSPVGDFGPVGGSGFLQGFVVTVPEPSVFALAGLGAASLMAFRRKKA